MKNFVYTSVIFLLISFGSCKRKSEQITTDPEARLSFSQQKITFDTIFSSLGSVTKRLWVYNRHKHAVNISSISLGRLYSSSYKLLINGEEQISLSNYELAGKDSMLMLVKVLIDPQNQSLPYLVDDSIVFVTNGNIQDVDLLAYGQDAFFLTNETVACNAIWTNIKPYVITGNVTVPPGCTLTLDVGTRLRFHKDATLTVAGTLLSMGTKDSIVTLKHDNLSLAFENLPGQWGGLIFQSGSKNNLFVYTEIKNAVNALTLEPEADSDTIPEVFLQNSVLQNSSQHMVRASNTDLYAVNSLFNNCPGFLCNVSSGGNYYFDFCTLANYSYDFFRNTPAIRFSNEDVSANDLVVSLRNSIVWGDQFNEILLHDNNVNAFTISADYCILKTSLTIGGENTLFNQNPSFESEFLKNFSLKATSPALNSGLALPSVTTDLKGNARDSNPDRGCYEKQ